MFYLILTILFLLCNLCIVLFFYLKYDTFKQNKIFLASFFHQAMPQGCITGLNGWFPMSSQAGKYILLETSPELNTNSLFKSILSKFLLKGRFYLQYSLSHENLEHSRADNSQSRDGIVLRTNTDSYHMTRNIQVHTCCYYTLKHNTTIYTLIKALQHINTVSSNNK